ncbi:MULTISPECIES: DHH family phosphoesterase [Thermoanaerobacterium]|uniref:Cyclic-di-AMP phosphodiesterase n=2 Tax=Thermoanaerobacterium TaxID=28895 RepID=W9ECC1_9THEO|nr:MULTISPECIES: DHH family phosphoesterase [Thermoanaerobacterium]AFK85551.1 putative phosphoesterase [Thermoanaerobacterium saccharolyticum JW/SL-YS485]ETO39732.1 putative phosphoesterase [Thermoanaerobacterium aotearoense SCUT27]
MFDKKNYKLISSVSLLNIILSAVLTLVLMYYNVYISIVSMVLLAYILYIEYKGAKKKRTEFDKYIERLFFSVDKASGNVLSLLPIPVALMREDGSIVWYNSCFAQNFEDKKDINNVFLKYAKSKKDEKYHFRIGNKYYYMISIISKTKKRKPKDGENYYNVFIFDETDYMEISRRLANSRTVLGYILVDNYEEALQSADDLNKPVVAAEIERRLNIWIQSMNAYIIKYANDRYIFVTQEADLKNLEENRFEILDFVRDINVGNKIPITLSIGVGADSPEFAKLNEYAVSAIDLALGRGGDQAVVKRGEKILIYGGKTQAVEKRTKVKARVVAHAIRELIGDSSNVLLMGHNFMDFDSLGAAIGMYRCAVSFGKDAKIVLDKSNPAIETLLEKIERDEEYANPFIDVGNAKNMVNPKTLLIVVDAHRPSYLTYPELVNMVDRIVVIDHHRRGKEFIDKALLIYLEPYASSTCELVTEISQYIKDKIDLKPIEAEALLAGITVDTKNFTFRTGVRTFEAASYLRRKGADTISVKMLFQNDLKSYIIKSTIVKNAEITEEGIAIAVSPDETDNVIAAQAADELLNIKGVQASFVVFKRHDDVAISGRSIGDINVQVILEKLGGGGHLTVAGAQLKKPLKNVVDDLKKAIEEYFKEGES